MHRKSEIKDGTKKCVQCNKFKSFSEFYRDKKAPGGVVAVCKKCRKKLYKIHYKNNRDKYIDSHLRYEYGITLNVKNDMILKQNYRCAICGEPFKDNYDTHIDHDHISGKVRDVLCQGCNIMLGGAKDNKEILLKGIEYLMKHGG